MVDLAKELVEQQVQVVGQDHTTVADVVAGRLSVATSPPATPSGATSVIIVESDDVSGTDDNVYTITNTKTLHMSLLSSGSESSNSGAVCKLYYDPNGNGVGMTLIEVIYTNGASNQIALDEQYVGDGTAAIRLRRTNLTGGNVEITAKWIGYEE